MISPERRKTMEKQNWQVVGRTGFLWMEDDGRFWNRWHSRLLIADEGYSQKGLLVVITAGLMILRPGDTDWDSSGPFFLKKA